MSFMVGTYSDIGPYRRVNQDACCFLKAMGPAGPIALAIVCDGVGGFSSGELASSTVISRFCAWFEECLPIFLQQNTLDEDFWAKLKNVWGELLRELNVDIMAFGKSRGISLGTTFTGMFVYDNRCLVGQVGDSRAYEIPLSSGNLTCYQITKDQTVIAFAVEAGMITPEEAACHPRRHVLLQAVGTQEMIDPSFVMRAFQKDAVYLVCSDGFYGRIEPRDISEAFSQRLTLQGGGSQSLGEACRSLAELGINRGEKDNVTAVAFAATSANDVGALFEKPSDFADTLSFEAQFTSSREEGIAFQPIKSGVLAGNNRFTLEECVILINARTEIDECCAEVINRFAHSRSWEGDTL